MSSSDNCTPSTSEKSSNSTTSSSSTSSSSSSSSSSSDINIVINFQGGLDYLFDRVKQLKVPIPSGSTMSDLISLLVRKYVKERVELFSQDGESVRPGILVMINDRDWELFDTHSYVLQDKDNIVFISSLHGG